MCLRAGIGAAHVEAGPTVSRARIPILLPGCQEERPQGVWPDLAGGRRAAGVQCPRGQVWAGQGLHLRGGCRPRGERAVVLAEAAVGGGAVDWSARPLLTRFKCGCSARPFPSASCSCCASLSAPLPPGLLAGPMMQALGALCLWRGFDDADKWESKEFFKKEDDKDK